MKKNEEVKLIIATYAEKHGYEVFSEESNDSPMLGIRPPRHKTRAMYAIKGQELYRKAWRDLRKLGVKPILEKSPCGYPVLYVRC